MLLPKHPGFTRRFTNAQLVSYVQSVPVIITRLSDALIRRRGLQITASVGTCLVISVVYLNLLR